MFDNKTSFKEVIYFPSFSGHYGYYVKNKNLIDNINYRFYQEDSIGDDPKWLHKFFLLSAGILYKKMDVRDAMGLDRDKGNLVMGDSGGHQICVGTLKWSVDLRDTIFNWLENNSDVAINIDIPPRDQYEGKFQEALDFSYDNFKWFNEHQTGRTQFLNVIQGNESEEYVHWYNKVKGFDFNGWSVGGGFFSLTRMMFALATLLQNREFENKKNKWLHFLGQTKVREFFIYNYVTKWFNEVGLDHVNVMTDSSTPIQLSVWGNSVYSPNLENLNYRLMYYPKSVFNKLSVEDCKKMPFPSYVQTNISKAITMADIRGLGDKIYDTRAQHLLTHHNLCMFKHMMWEIRQLSHLELGLLEPLIGDKDFIKVLSSIRDMIYNPDDALKIARKYRALYDTYSQKEVYSPDNSLMDEFFE